jgi:hypothetical protein
MSLSIFLTIYFLFLIVYGALLGFAVYKVFLFAKNRDLKGHSRRITLVFLIIVLSVVFISFLLIPRYHWDDNIGFYCKKISKSCSCESDSVKRDECIAKQKIDQEAKKAEQSAKTKQDNATKKTQNDSNGGQNEIRPSHYFFID